MKTIYLALKHYDHEGFDVIGAFESEADAEARIAPLKARLKVRPRMPATLNRAEWDARAEAMEVWRRGNPPDHEEADAYTVDPVEFYPCNPKGGE